MIYSFESLNQKKEDLRDEKSKSFSPYSSGVIFACRLWKQKSNSQI